MISAALLAAYAAAAGTMGAAWLRESAWITLAPRLAIAAWQALAASVLLASAGTGLALAMSLTHLSGDLATLLHLCAENLRHGYASPGGALTAGFGVAAFAALLVRTLWCAVTSSANARQERTARVAVLDLVGRSDIVAGVLVVEHEAPYAFCVGGRRKRIVVTSALLATLSEVELRAVLAHERAHLRQRHHIALLICRTLFGTLSPLFPGFRTAMSDVRLCAELSADDSARRHVGARPLRDALMTLACLPAPSGALAASGHDVERRLLRLSAQQRRLTLPSAVLGSVGIAVAILIPLALAAGPALAMAWEGICLLG